MKILLILTQVTHFHPAYLSRASIDNLLATTPPNNSQVTNSAYSAYVSNVLNITPGMTVLAELRADYFDPRAEKSDPDDDFVNLHYLLNSD